MEAAVSMSSVMSPGSSARMLKRSLRVQAISGLLRFLDDHAVLSVVLAQTHGHALPSRGGQVLADVVGANGQLPVAAVDEHGELHHLGAAEVDHGVERGADRASGEEDIVHEDDALVLDG